MATDRMDVLELLRKATSDGDVDLLREGVRVLSQALMEAEVAAEIGAAHGERAPERRSTQRNGYRPRRWDTRVGSVELQIPELREGTYFPRLLEPRRRAERALLSVVQEESGTWLGGSPWKSRRPRVMKPFARIRVQHYELSLSVRDTSRRVSGRASPGRSLHNATSAEPPAS